MSSGRRYGLVSGIGALALAFGVVACGAAGDSVESSPTSSTASLSAAPSSAPPTPSPTPDVRVIEVHIVGGDVHTDSDQVEVATGEAVRLIVTSDVDDELHVHGVETTAALVAGEPTTLEFTTRDEPGVYEVETHDGGLLLFQLLVR
jgi:hypothetical protein